jgi:hypothetical protein
MKINFLTQKKGNTKEDAAHRFLKKGRAPDSLIYGLESDWIKML